MSKIFGVDLQELRKDRSTQHFIEVGVNVVLALCLLWFGARPLISDVVLLRDQREVVDDMANRLTTKVANLQEARESVTQFEPVYPFLRSALPLEPKQFDMLNQIKIASELDQVLVEQLTHKADQSGNMVEFSVTGRGEYEPVTRFVERLEQLPRLIQITDIAVDSAGDPANPGELVFTVAGTGYYYTSEISLMTAEDNQVLP